MVEPRIKYYPVDNGDTSLITLSDETKILIDISITEASQEEKNDERYDVKRDLLDNELKKNNNNPFVDVFILSHPDQDHIRGFEKHFFKDDLSNYTKEDRKDELIQIFELWYSPKVFERYNNQLSDDAKAFKKEAKRRMDLYKKDKNEANKDGNRLRIIGYSDNDELKGLEDRMTIPGNIINEFNGKAKDDFELFIHGPLKDDIKDDDRNESSIVFQARFSVDNVEKTCLAFWGGDAGWRVWESILDKSEEEDLQWDLFLAPHHCSWTFFNDNTDEGKKEVQKSAKKMLEKRIGENAKIISSSKEVKNNDDNPPSYKAKTEYVKIVGSKNFHCLATDSNTTPPEPIEFEVKSTGGQKKNRGLERKILKASLIGEATGNPKTYGITKIQ
ncbi:MAG: cobyric acid synthase CobQ [Bacteroidia bacterium]|nr:cobyric acid synthase CobQ [Bacteroidia bacterium]